MELRVPGVAKILLQSLTFAGVAWVHIFGAGAPGGPAFEASEKDKKTSELPFAGNAAAIQAAPEAPKAFACLPFVPVGKRTKKNPIDDVLQLPCIWNVMMAKVEANVLAAWRLYQPISKEGMSHTLTIMQTPEGENPQIHQPIVQTMNEFLPVVVPPLAELIDVAFTPELKDEIVAESKWTEDRICALLSAYPQKFNQCRDLQKKGAAWPHSQAMQDLWDKMGGFTRRPTMIKRDRLICDTCGEEVFAIIPAMQPQYYHAFRKHPATFEKELADKGLAVVQYKKQIPADDGSRQLLDYLLRHIDVYTRADMNNDLAQKWNLVRGWRGQTFGWAHVARYMQNPKEYVERNADIILKKGNPRYIEQSYPPAPAQPVTGVIQKK